MRSRIVEEVVRRGPAELAGKARALIPRTGNLATQLLEVGYPPSAILDGATAATGVRQAPPAWLREPSPPPVDYDDGLLFRQVGAAPVSTEAGTLCVAYGDPQEAADASTHGLPPHRPYLAMPAQLARAVALLPVEPTLSEPLPTEPTRRAAFALRSAVPKGSLDALDLIDDDDLAIDDALEGVIEATRTVPGGAPPQAPQDARPPPEDDAAASTSPASLAELRRVAQLSNQGARQGPASEEGVGFEDMRTQQVDLVSPAGRAAVEPTVTRSEPNARPPERQLKPNAVASSDDDYEDVATVALSKSALAAMMAPVREAPPAIIAAKPRPPDEPKAKPPDKEDDEEAFNDPTEHVAVLASRDELVAAKTVPKRQAAVPLTDPNPAPMEVVPPKAPSKPSVPWKPPSRLSPGAAAAELGATQPMPRHQQSTEMDVVPVPVARRGPSPMASLLSAAVQPAASEPTPPPKAPFKAPPKTPAPPARRAEPARVGASLDPDEPRPANPAAKHIPGFDDAAPPPEQRRRIPGFDDALDPSAPPRKGRTVMLHPPEPGGAAASALSQETEAEQPAPGPMQLDPSALEPVPLDLPAPEPAEPAAPDQTVPLDFLNDRDHDFSRPPIPTAAPPRPSPPSPPPPRFEQRAPMRAPVVEEPEPRAQRRGGGPVGGLQVLRAGAAPAAPPGLELAVEAPRAPAPAPLIPGIDSPMPSFGGEIEDQAPSRDGRSRQILIAAGIIAVLIIVGAGAMRVRATRGAGGAPPSVRPVPSVPGVPASSALPAVPPPADPAALAQAPRSPPPTSPRANGVDGGPSGEAAVAEEPSARQRELIDEARRLSDPAMAVALYTQAGGLGPQATGARDALFERAKLHLSVGDREHARADVQKLKRRDDTKDLARDLQLILDGAGPAGGGP